MARSRSHKKGRSPSHSRGYFHTASASHTPALRVRSTPTLEFLRPTEVLSTLMDVEDFRTWTPHRVRRPRTVSASYAGVSSSGDSPPARTPARSHIRNFFRRLRFKVPRTTLICIRRHRRREVLFARGRSGRGNRKPQYNRWSKVRC